MVFDIFIIIVFIILVFLAYVIFYNNYLYNAIFKRKSRKFWKFIIKNADKFEYIENHALGKIFVWGDYVAYIWNDNTCSIHINTPNRHECLVAHTDEVMANKMRDLLLSKIK